MRAVKMLGVSLLFFAWTILYPASQAHAYFAEDSFAPLWEQGIQPVKAGGHQEQSGAQLVIHRVAAGETLWSLARYYRVEVARLMVVNGISDPTRLSVGRILVIPRAKAPAGSPAHLGGNHGAGAASGTQQRPIAVKAIARGWNGSLIWPLLGELTQQFGPQLNGTFHHGLDIAGNTGMPIEAAQRGLVICSGWLPFYGDAVIIDHGSGFRTLYAHLHDFVAHAGDLVQQGQIIAHVGSTGNADGPHLHFEVRFDNRSVNPLPYLSDQ